MRLERVKRWQWVVLSLVVGLALAQARRVGVEDLPSRLGEGVADRAWFEREVRRRVTLADGSTIPAFGRLTVYPASVQERGGRRPVHLVAGMYLAQVGDGGNAPSAAVGKLRPYFFIAPAPYPLAAGQPAGKPANPNSTVREFLDGLKGSGVTYRYAWWADPRWSAAAWIGGSFVLIGLLWPTALNLMVYGTFRAPAAEKGVSLWKVKSATPRRPTRAATPAPVSPPAGRSDDASVAPERGIAPAVAPAAETVHAAVPVLSSQPAVAVALAAGHEHKEFGAKRDDFYPTELKAAHDARPKGQ
jgi:hypothetical protein